MKTNAVRRLEEMGLRHEPRAYEVDPDDLTAGTVAAKVGLPAAHVFKTLVARGDRHGVCFAVVPGDCRLDLKALARLTGGAQSPFLKIAMRLHGPVVTTLQGNRVPSGRAVVRAIPTPLLRYLAGLEEWLVFEVNDYLRSIRAPRRSSRGTVLIVNGTSADRGHR